MPHSLLDSRVSKELRRHLFDELDGHGISIPGKSGIITEGIRSFFVADFMTKPDSFGEWTLSPRAWDETTATAGEDGTRSQITTTPSNQTNQVT